MAKHKVTEEDIRLTEALIGQSYCRLKTSVTKAPHDLIRPATSTIRDHPIITTAAAAGIGLSIFKLISLLSPRVVVREVPAHRDVTIKESGQPTLMTQLATIAAPYLTSVLRHELGKMMAGQERGR